VDAKQYLARVDLTAQRSSLTPYHADILELREAGCTLAQITEFLRLNNVSITFSSVARYLRKHADAAQARAKSSCALAEPPPVSAHGQLGPSTQSAQAASIGEIKAIEQLRAENPTTPAMQLAKMYAQQYDRPAITAEGIAELKRRFPQRSKA
jgi:DNA-binding transcriptional MerR regulator